MNGETVIGLGVLVILGLYLVKVYNEPAVVAPVTVSQAPTTTRGQSFSLPALQTTGLVIPTLQAAPDLMTWKPPSGPGNKDGQGPQPPKIISSNPCSCGCDNGSSNLIIATAQGFVDSLNDVGKTALQNYANEIQSQLPDYVKQFLENPAADAAAKVAQSDAQSFGFSKPQKLGTTVAWKSGGGTTSYTPGSNAVGDYYKDYLTGKTGTNLVGGLYGFNYHTTVSM